jgi:hypothetical protein
MKQVTITERNLWEREVFSYIIDLDEETILEFKNGLKNNSNVKIEENTTYTKEKVEELNAKSRNSYMDRFQFVQFEQKPDYDFKWYDDVVYKAKGFKRLR